MMIYNEIKLKHHQDSISSLVFSHDNKLLASLSILTDRRVVVWNTETWSPVSEFYSGPGTTRLWFSPENNLLLGTGVNKEIMLWNIASQTSQVISYIDINPLIRFVSANNIQTIFCRDRSIDYYDLWTQALSRHISLPSSYSSIFHHCGWISNDARLIAIEDRDHSIQIWDVFQDKATLRLTGASNYIRDVAFHPAFAHLACATDDSSIIEWDLDSGAINSRFISSRTDIWEIIYHPTLPILAVIYEDSNIELWNTHPGTLLATLSGHAPQITAAYSPNGKILVSGSEDGVVHIWNLMI